MLKRMTLWVVVLCCLAAAGGELRAGLLVLSGGAGPDLGQTPQAVWPRAHDSCGQQVRSRDHAVAVWPQLARGASRRILRRQMLQQQWPQVAIRQKVTKYGICPLISYLAVWRGFPQGRQRVPVAISIVHGAGADR